MKLPRGLVLGSLALTACQSEPAWERDLAVLKHDVAEVRAPEPAVQPVAVAWEALGDCRARLRHLLSLDAAGVRLDPEHLPFAVVVGAPLDRVRFAPPAVPVAADLPIAVDPPGASSRPCVIRLERPHAVAADRRIVGQEAVASEYQSGTRREDNPAYELAELRARQAERAFKQASGDGWSEVGDPMFDLVGVLVGSVVGGFREAGSEREMNDALMELAKTPRKIDRPVWTAYHFERLVIDGQKQAELPVELIDQTGGPSVRTTIRQTERRRFYIPKGLHERDRDYLRHRAQSITREGLDAWQRSAPEVGVSQLVTALVDAPATGPGGPTAAASAVGDDHLRWPEPSNADDVIAGWADAPAHLPSGSLAAGPPGAHTAFGLRSDRPAEEFVPLELADEAGRGVVRPTFARRAPRSAEGRVADPDADPRFRSVVEVRGAGGGGSGFYVAQRLVVSSRRVVGEAGMADVTTADGTGVPGMVVAADVGRDLALIHVPRAGPPVRLHDGPMPRPGQQVEALGNPDGLGFSLSRGTVSGVRERGSIPAPGLQTVRYIQTDVAMAPGHAGGPLFLGDRVIGVNGSSDGDGRSGLTFAIHVDELRAFLDEENGTTRGER